MPKTRFKNIYKKRIRKFKKTIDFDERMCYHIVKERKSPEPNHRESHLEQVCNGIKDPKSCREVGTGAFQIFERRKGPMER